MAISASRMKVLVNAFSDLPDRLYIFGHTVTYAESIILVRGMSFLLERLRLQRH